MRIALLILFVAACRTAGGDPRVSGMNPGSTGGTGGTSGPTNMDPDPGTRDFQCICVAGAGDRDGDCEPDGVEDTNGSGSFDAGDFTDVDNADSDSDGIPDGCEDWNHNGVVDSFPRESDPRVGDSDGDGIPDGLEDRNHNGRPDPGETSSTSEDGDNDGIPDGEEDRNHNGVWDCPEDPSGPPCETKADAIDTDDDGILDIIELKSFAQDTPNFRFCIAAGPDPCAGTINGTCGDRVYAGLDGIRGNSDDQTCPWQADSDGDLLPDGIEDTTADGRLSTGETNPRDPDSDDDGLPDGVEDSNKDGLWDAMTETDPTRVDTDGDGIGDGVEDSGGCLTDPAVPPAVGETCSGDPTALPLRCICGFWRNGTREAFESDPRTPDTDGDGLRDGAEDRNGDGVCQLPPPRDVPRASDETCAFDNDSDGDSLVDGAEDINGNGLIDASLNETDARRADPDNDCLTDPYELFTGVDPFRPDTDEDGLADGLETDRRLRFDQATRTCVPLSCGGTQIAYQSTSCPDPNVRDSDGDGFVDGFEIINGVATGEDENADGCKAVFETNPCGSDTPSPPVIGDPDSTVCTLPAPLECEARDLRKCDTCATTQSPSNYCGGDSTTCVENAACTDSSPCKVARKLSQALICAEGNIRPVVLVRSSENDYSLALPASKGTLGVPESLFEFEPSTFSFAEVGHLFQSKDAISNTGTEPIRSVFGGITRMGTFELGTPDKVLDDPPLQLVDGSGTGNVIGTTALTPSDVAGIAADRLRDTLLAAGYTIARTAGGTVPTHDDESTSGRANASIIRRATDRFIVRRVDAAQVEATQVARLVGKALLGGNETLNALVPPESYFRGPVAEMKITYYKRVVKRRTYDETGTSVLSTIAQYGALWALADLNQDCSALTGTERRDCREANEPALNSVDDLANGSALARVQAEVGRACDPFDPKKAKADFLIVIDDSGSMQKNIIAIQRGARDVASRLRANAENMDWRIGMTTSNMGGGLNTNAPLEEYGPWGTTVVGAYPKLDPAAPPLAVDALAAYQHTAYDNDGLVKTCEYGDSYSAQNPLVSPYCCHFSNDNASVNPLTYLRACCSLGADPEGDDFIPSFFSGTGAFPARDFDLSDADGSSYGPTFAQNDTLRCYDFPRFAEDLSTWTPTVSRYPTTGNNPTEAQRMRHFNDYLCGKVSDAVGFPPGAGPIPLWGTRGYLWPPGFAGVDTANPRLDGANLLIRNADMLVVQMNRDCTGNDAGGNVVWSPRARNGSGAESMLQAAKRAVERATANGRTGAPTALREDAPLITVILSDEEDFSGKFKNVDTDRDKTQLAAARCVKNGDLGCTVPYCQACFNGAMDEGANAGNLGGFAMPAARRYDELTDQMVEDPQNGAFCTAPIPSAGNASANTPIDADCPASGSTFCATGSDRYNGQFKIAAGIDENALANQGARVNGIPDDVLNFTLNTGSQPSGVTCGCPDGSQTDCQPCMRFLRERPYIDFFSGQCSSNDVSDPTAPLPVDEPRRYPRPAATVAGGKLVLPLGPVYAITRSPGQQGGTQGSCGATYAGGDGLALRDVALGTGGSVADICPQSGGTEPNFAEFLDQVIVDAQGFGSPYRLRGNPISATIRVGVMDRFGNFRLLKRSSVAGFDYNSATNTVAFFARDDMDITNQISLTRDAVVYVSYRVWERRCPEDCPLGDACAICTCSPGRPDCCTATPTFECQPPAPCAQGCGPCETCDFATNQCRSENGCDAGCGQCTTGSGGPTCTPCQPGTVPVEIPCIPTSEGGGCPAVPITVCVTPQGVPNTGTNCAVTTPPACCGTSSCTNGEDCGADCCGSNKTCPAGEICVLEACNGESCLPKAKCREVTGSAPPTDACGTCPTGTVCAPVPCAGESCPPKFQCIASNQGSSGTCDVPPECSCPGAICPDCPLGNYCDANSQCQPLCDANVSLAECCADGGPRDPMLACCPAGEAFDPSTNSCVPGGYSCNCPPEAFCDPFSGRCILRGG